MRRSRFIFIGFIFSILISCKAGNSKSELLYGDWIFIDSYESRVTDIKNLSKTPSPFMDPIIVTYKKNGEYINDQGDYKTSGKFMFDDNNSILKEFDDNGEVGDTLNLQITHLDEHYLLVVAMDSLPISYFYTRK